MLAFETNLPSFPLSRFAADIVRFAFAAISGNKRPPELVEAVAGGTAAVPYVGSEYAVTDKKKRRSRVTRLQA